MCPLLNLFSLSKCDNHWSHTWLAEVGHLRLFQVWSIYHNFDWLKLNTEDCEVWFISTFRNYDWLRLKSGTSSLQLEVGSIPSSDCYKLHPHKSNILNCLINHDLICFDMKRIMDQGGWIGQTPFLACHNILICMHSFHSMNIAQFAQHSTVCTLHSPS